MNSDTPLVSVIIVTCDRAQVLRLCLEHVLAQEYSRFEVIVVDNSSQQVETLTVVKDFPSICYISSDPGHANPAYMRNQGIKRSSGEILAFIDDDSLVASGWMAALVEGFTGDLIGGVCGRVVEDSAPIVCTPNIGKFMSDGRIVMNFNNEISESIPVDFLYGCNLAVHRDVIAKVGRYDEWYGITYEETDLSFRIREAGFTLLFLPGMQVKHLRAPRPNKTVQRSDSLLGKGTYLSARSLTYLCTTHFGFHLAFGKVIFFTLPKAAVRDFIKEPKLAHALRVFVFIVAGIVGSAMTIAKKLKLNFTWKINT